MLRTELSSGGGLARAAEALAGALQGTREWSEWQEAKSAFEGDAETGRLMARYQELAARWPRIQARGGGLGGKEALELAELQDRIEHNVFFSQQQQAGAALLAMLRHTNQIISAKLGIDFAANATPPRGGSGCCG